MAREVSQRAITLVKDARDQVPLKLPRTAVSQFEMMIPEKGLEFTITPASAFSFVESVARWLRIAATSVTRAATVPRRAVTSATSATTLAVTNEVDLHTMSFFN